MAQPIQFLGARLDRALFVRDQLIKSFPLRLMAWANEDIHRRTTLDRLEISFRMPFPPRFFQPGQSPLAVPASRWVDHGFGLPFGLDIWELRDSCCLGRADKKMNLEWGFGGEVDLISFRGGRWFADVLACLAARRFEH